MPAKKHILTLAAAAAFTATLAATPATATTIRSHEMTCPVGGKTFTAKVMGSTTYVGQRPDGRDYLAPPFMVPECPDNGLPLYRTFKPDEIPALTKLVLGAEFQALRQDNAAYRTYWLMEKMGDGDAMSRTWLLNIASQLEDENPAKKARYQRLFAERAATFPADPSNTYNNEYYIMQARAANAWRELGDFDRAKTVLAAIPLDELRDINKATKDSPAESRLKLADFIEKLGKVIDRKDASSEPLGFRPKE